MDIKLTKNCGYRTITNTRVQNVIPFVHRANIDWQMSTGDKNAGMQWSNIFKLVKGGYFWQLKLCQVKINKYKYKERVYYT